MQFSYAKYNSGYTNGQERSFGIGKLHFSDLHAAASTAAQKEQLQAAGEAVIAANMWNSSAGFLAGIFMQGGFVFISFVMLRSQAFGKGTAYTGSALFSCPSMVNDKRIWRQLRQDW